MKMGVLALTIGAILLIAGGSAVAQEDCIENAAGRTVCGADAAAVRARIRAEQAYRNGDAKRYKRKRSTRSRSVYRGYKNTVGLRGGAFVAGSTAADYFSGLGYSRRLNNSVHAIKADFELTLIGTTSAVAGGGVASLMWQYEAGKMQPYLGVGAGYLADEFHGTFVVQGRAGVNFQIIDWFAVEGGYRYMNFTDADADGHGAEVNLNFDF